MVVEVGRVTSVYACAAGESIQVPCLRLFTKW
jgi:hypothetical protein